MALIFAGGVLSPAAADRLTSESGLGCLAIAADIPSGLDPADRNVLVDPDCDTDTARSWVRRTGGVGTIGAPANGALMCLTVDFRVSLDGQGGTFNVFAAADCAKALFWEVRSGFISAEIAATVYCLEVSDDPQTPSNVIARIGCSGDDGSVWVID